ncbi:MAG: hypothetical protein H6574_22035 [Lewinellaceae bacterium]|nr:hypothetical protein [Saprospiraceae bacterium]MCB9316937.1 hypothetical protein [Lewinellaceae bacterium]MCB9333744.1 hypothetical protein [Lewinellaceae bacterium]
MARLTALFFLFYMVAFLGLRWYIHAPGKHLDQQPVRSEADLLQHSDRHDFKRLRLKGAVLQSGDYFWDLLLIPTYQIKTTRGLTLTVFSSASVPAEGRYLEVVGVFRQYYRGSYGCWLGLVELERKYPAENNPAAGLIP